MTRLGNGLVWIFAGLLALGCGESGQTGSASCALPTTCECEGVAGRVLAKATVLAIESGQVSLHIEEQLNASAGTSALPLASKTLKGPLVSVPCWPNAGQLMVGDSVFATFRTDDQCPAYYDCAIKCYPAPNNQSTDACLGECTKQCDPHTVYAYPWLQPWGDTIELSPLTTVTVADAVALSDGKMCDERFPPPPPQACPDTVGPTSGDGCSFSQPMNHSGGTMYALAVLLGLGTLLSRRAETRR